MPIYAEKKEGGFTIPEPGTFVARCISMIELGTIPVDFGNGEKMQKQVLITWELPTELHVFDEAKGEQPFVVSKTYNLSMNKTATLRIDLQNWRGKEYTEEEASKVDITKLIGQACQLSIIHRAGVKDSSKTYVKISAITKLMKGMTCPPQVNPSRLLCYDNFDWNVFDNLSDFVKDQVKSSEEFKKMQEPDVSHDGVSVDATNDDDNLPF
jgi:hypothetical protein